MATRSSGLATRASKGLICCFSIGLLLIAVVQISVGAYVARSPGFLASVLPTIATRTLIGVGLLNMVASGLSAFIVCGRASAGCMRILLGVTMLLTLISILSCVSGIAVAFAVSDVAKESSLNAFVDVEGGLDWLQDELYHSLLYAFKRGFGGCAPTAFLTSTVLNACNSTGLPYCNKGMPKGHVGLFCKHKPGPFAGLSFPDPARPLADAGTALESVRFDAWMNWACMPTYSDALVYSYEIDNHEIASVLPCSVPGAERGNWSECKTRLPTHVLQTLEFRSKSKLRGEKVAAAYWDAVSTQLEGWKPKTTFGRCYASEWWPPADTKSGSPFDSYPNGTAFSPTDRAFFESLGPDGGQGWPFNPKMPFCYCAERGMNALTAYTSHTSGVQWGMMVATVVLLLLALIGESFLMCCVHDKELTNAYDEDETTELTKSSDA